MARLPRLLRWPVALVIGGDLLLFGASFLRTAPFASDYDFHAAVVTEFVAALQNRHNTYYGPPCYQTYFWNPLTLSSTTRFGNEQIVFVDRPSLGGVWEGLEELQQHGDNGGAPPSDGG